MGRQRREKFVSIIIIYMLLNIQQAKKYSPYISHFIHIYCSYIYLTFLLTLVMIIIASSKPYSCTPPPLLLHSLTSPNLILMPSLLHFRHIRLTLRSDNPHRLTLSSRTRDSQSTQRRSCRTLLAPGWRVLPPSLAPATLGTSSFF